MLVNVKSLFIAVPSWFRVFCGLVFTALAAVLLVGLLFSTRVAYALEVYKSINADGDVVLSDRPIEGSGAKQDVVHLADLPDQPSALPASPMNDRINEPMAAVSKLPVSLSPSAVVKPAVTATAAALPPQTQQPVINARGIKQLVDLRTQLFRLQSFYQKVQDDYQRVPSVNTQDENYRRTLINLVEKHLEGLEKNIVALEHSVGPLPTATLSMTDDAGNTSHSSLPLSSTQIAKLANIFPER